MQPHLRKTSDNALTEDILEENRGAMELEYRKMLMELSKMLGGFSLRGFVFLCGEKIPKKLRERIKEPPDLWETMQERDMLSRENLGFLKWMLVEGAEGRTDLVRVVERYEDMYGLGDGRELGSGLKLHVKRQESELDTEGTRASGAQSSDVPFLPSGKEATCNGTNVGTLEVTETLHHLSDKNDLECGQEEAKPKEVSAEDNTVLTNVREADQDVNTLVGSAPEIVPGVIPQNNDCKCRIVCFYPNDAPKDLKHFYPRDGEPVYVQEGICFGRGLSAKVRLNDDTVSREQLIISLVFNQRLQKMEFVLKNVSSRKTVTLDNQELGFQQARALAPVSFLRIKDLTLKGEIQLIMNTHIPADYSASEFEVVFEQDSFFYAKFPQTGPRGPGPSMSPTPPPPPSIGPTTPPVPVPTHQFLHPTIATTNPSLQYFSYPGPIMSPTTVFSRPFSVPHTPVWHDPRAGAGATLMVPPTATPGGAYLPSPGIGLYAAPGFQVHPSNHPSGMFYSPAGY